VIGASGRHSCLRRCHQLGRAIGKLPIDVARAIALIEEREEVLASQLDHRPSGHQVAQLGQARHQIGLKVHDPQVQIAGGSDVFVWPPW